MKKFGCLISLLGIVVFLVSFFLFGVGISRALDASQAFESEFEIDKGHQSETVLVSTQQECNIRLTASITATSVKVVRESGETELQPRFSFPYSVVVTTEKGKEIFSENGEMTWDQESGPSISEKQLTAEGGTATLSESFGNFKVMPPGKLKVSVKVMPDKKYGTQAPSWKVEVYDNIKDVSDELGSGALSFFAGPAIAGLGMLIFFIGIFADSPKARRRP